MDYTSFKTPGQLLQALIERQGWTKRVLSIVLGIGESTINKLVSDKQSITADLALSLSEVFAVPAEVFLDLQQSYDLAKAKIAARPDPGRKNRAHLFGGLPITEMMRRGWIEGSDIRDVPAVESALAKFFGVASSNDIEILPHAAKKTQVFTEPTSAQLAWLYRVRQIATELIAPPYSPDALKPALPKLRSLLSAPEEARKVPRILAESGIRFVIVESLPSAKIDGVCFWLNPVSPVIGMTLRFDRIDNFWFVLRHELEHVRLGHGMAAAMLDAELEGERAGTGANIAEEERLANAAARNFCVPDNEMAGFISRKEPFFAERDIVGFARTLGVHPGIVSGQLQRKTNRYDRFRDHLAKIRQCVLPSAAVDGWGNIYPLGT
jgi:HTH-type transcriptional regulator/antitoxin HigA